MDNLFYGIITISFCLAGYVLSFKHYTKNNIPTALLLITLCGLILRLYCATDLFLHPWDERYHALVAKNLVAHPLHPTLYDNPVLPYDYKNWTANHTWLHKQPLTLWAMAAGISVFGPGETVVRLPSVLLSTIGIVLSFHIAKFFFNNRVALLSAFLYSIHGLIIEVASGRAATDHIDAFFLFFIQLSVFLAIRYFQTKKTGYNILCGISIGMAVLSKWLPALIVLPIWLLLALDAKNMSIRQIAAHFLLLCLLASAVFIPWQLYIFSTFPAEAQWESSYNVKHLSESVENHGQPFYYHLDKVRMLYGELIYLPLGWFFFKTFKKPGNYRRVILCIWIAIPFLFFSIAKTKMQAYTLFTAPALFMVTALFWQYLYTYRKKFSPRARVLVFGTLVLLIALPVRYSLERIKPFDIREREPQWAQELKELKRNLKGRGDSILIFNTEHPVEAMFYTDCTAYTDIPGTPLLSELSRKGYTILIRNTQNEHTQAGLAAENGIHLPAYNVIYARYTGEQ